MEDGVRKVYVGDTSVFISDPGEGEENGAIERLSRGNMLVIPYTVLQELDHLKEGRSERNRAAREVIRRLFKYRDSHPLDMLEAGIPMPNDGLLVFAAPPRREEMWEGYDSANEDDGIILVARRYASGSAATPNSKAWLITKDVAMSLRAARLGVETMPFESERPRLNHGPYTGMARIQLPPDGAGFLTTLSTTKEVAVELLGDFGELPTLYPNQCCEIVAGARHAYAIYKNGGRNFLRHVATPKKGEAKPKKGIAPRNPEQALALDLLADPDHTIVSLAGKSGSGKTILALAAGYEFLRRGDVSTIIVYRSAVEAGKELGFRPGDLDEKFAPFTQPVLDNMQVVLREDGAANWHNRLPIAIEHNWSGIEEMLVKGVLEISPFNFLRGRSLHRAWVIVDDAQNLSRQEMKLILTRLCDGSRVILTGDPKQVDRTDEDEVTNGFSQVIERFKGREHYAHLALPKSERGWLANLADDLL